MHHLIPKFIHEQYQAGVTDGELTAVTLFMDISGFTVMTQTLMRHGQEGAEVLARLINRIFRPVILAVYDRGGFIIGFAGDAFTAVFLHEEEGAARRASAAALVIQEILAVESKQATRFGEFVLAVRLGVADGDIRWGIVGPAHHKSYFFRGPGVESCFRAEGQASAGEVIVTQAIQQALPAETEVSVRGGTYAVLHQLPEPATEILGEKPASANVLMIQPDIASQFFPLDLWLMPTQEAEFRDVAILFLSFRGVDTLADVDALVTHTMPIIEQFGGYFCEMEFGDKGGLMLLYFGAPVSHENDLGRALDFVLTWEKSLLKLSLSTAWQWRMGLTVGPVYVGLMGISLRGKYSALGDTVNFAARLMTRAEWGQVLVSDEVVKRQPDFQYHLEGSWHYKGFKEGIDTYSLLGRKYQQDADFETVLFGRSQELAQLVTAAHPLLEGRFAGAALIYGEAGIGKSHLANELRQVLGDKVMWLTGRADEVLRQSFHPFISILRRYFGVVADAPPEENQANFNQRWQILQLSLAELPSLDAGRLVGEISEDLEQRKWALASLLGLASADAVYEGLELKGRQENILFALKNLFLAESCLQPLVLVLEDGQWMDEASQTTLETLTRQVEMYPLFVVITARYRGDGQKPSFSLAPNTATVSIELDSLDKESLRYLAEHILGGPITARLNDLLYVKTGANPFFTQQLLYYFEETNLLLQVETRRGKEWGITDLDYDLPPSIKTVLMARIDRLAQQVKEVVQTAAVLGREIDIAVLQKVLQEWKGEDENFELEPVLAMGVEERIWQNVNEWQYMFCHILLQEAAYSMQLRRRVRSLHLLAAQTIERLYADSLSQHYESLCYHYRQAEAWDDEFHYVWLAGEKMLLSCAFNTAVSYWQRALALLPQVLQDELPLYRDRMMIEGEIKLGTVHRQLGKFKEASEYLRRSVAKALEQEHKPLAIMALNELGHIAMDVGDNDLAESYLQQAVVYSEETKHQSTLFKALWGMGWLEYRRGNYEASQAYAERCLAQADTEEHKADAGNLLGALANHYGHYEEALVYYEEALVRYRRVGHRSGESACLSNLGEAARYKEDYYGARSYYEEALRIDREIGKQFGALVLMLNLGHTACALEEWGVAWGWYRQTLHDAWPLKSIPILLECLAGMAQVHLATPQPMSKQPPSWAVKLLGMALAHPHIDAEAKGHAEAVLVWVRRRLSSTIIQPALEQGKDMKLEGVVTSLLAEV
ncbi:MAG TPA: AAA family ATPase [Anaerolineae bacterium]|nr:AAA family ATPase [Anaerolineae bacterium]